MGFVAPRKTFLLKYEGELAGLEVNIRSLSIGELMKFTVDMPKLMAQVQPAGDKADVTVMEPLFSLFTGLITSWNLEDEVTGADGKPARVPVPPTTEGLLSQDPDIAMKIIYGMQNTVVTAPPPLPDGSGPGPSTDLEASMPMESPSPSPPS